MLCGDLTCRFDATGPWHFQVHKDDIGSETIHRMYCLVAIFGFTHHLDAGFAIQQRSHTFSDDGVIVNQEDANWFLIGLCHAGTSMRMRDPAPGALSISRLPPRRATRSRIPARPNPRVGVSG